MSRVGEVKGYCTRLISHITLIYVIDTISATKVTFYRGLEVLADQKLVVLYDYSRGPRSNKLCIRVKMFVHMHTALTPPDLTNVITLFSSPGEGRGASYTSQWNQEGDQPDSRGEDHIKELVTTPHTFKQRVTEPGGGCVTAWRGRLGSNEIATQSGRGWRRVVVMGEERVFLPVANHIIGMFSFRCGRFIV